MLAPYQGISCLPTSAAFPRPEGQGLLALQNHNEETMTPAKQPASEKEGRFPPARKVFTEVARTLAIEEGLLEMLSVQRPLRGRPRL